MRPSYNPGVAGHPHPGHHHDMHPPMGHPMPQDGPMIQDGHGHGLPPPPPPPHMMPPSSYQPPMNSIRHPYPYQAPFEHRIFDLNRRLQQRSDECDNLWWETFGNEFFEDDATLTLTFCLEDGPKRYTIGRTLIPRYFRSILEGCHDLSFKLRHCKESFHHTSVTLDCEHATMITSHAPKPKEPSVLVHTEGRLTIEFTFDDLMRIRMWHFSTRQHHELIPRSYVANNCDPSSLEAISKNITRQGLTNSTLNYLRLCVILEPMQDLMTRHKTYQLSPRDCLKTTLFQRWQRMVSPPENQRPPSKRRKRKASTGTAAGKKKTAVSNAVSPGPPSFSLASQDVMVVGEPSLMGGEFGDEDERLITRLENHQYDPSANGGKEDFTSPPSGASWAPSTPEVRPKSEPGAPKQSPPH